MPDSGHELLRLEAFGAVDLRDRSGSPVTSVLAQPKRVAILLYLAAADAPGSFFHREKLLALFWPEFDDERARNSLRTALHYLRRSVGAGVMVGRSDGAIGLERRRLTCDVWEFEAAVKAGSWKEAVARIRGDFLDGFGVEGLGEFEGWMENRRSGLRRMAAEALWHRSVEEEDGGRLSAAVALGRRAMGLYPANELMLRRLLALHGRIGDRGAARAEYERFAVGLAERYELEPSPETRALLEAVISDGYGSSGHGGSESVPRGDPMGNLSAAAHGGRNGGPARRPSVALRLASPEPPGWEGSPEADEEEDAGAARVAILPFDVVPADTPGQLGRVLSELLTSELTKRGWNAVPPCLLGVEGRTGSPWERLRIAAGPVGARYLLSGVVLKMGDRILVEARLHRVGRLPDALFAVSLEGAEDEPLQLIAPLAGSLEGARQRLGPAPARARLPQPVP